MRPPCSHTEGFRSGDSPRSPVHEAFKRGRRPLPPDTDLHDCSYVSARNRLIPHADQIAAREVQAEIAAQKIQPGPAATQRHSALFLMAMDQLAREGGLVS